MMVAKMMMSIYLYMVIVAVAGSIGGLLALSDATKDADAVPIDSSSSPTTTKQRTLITKYQVRE
jgi:hypothetical protein